MATSKYFQYVLFPNNKILVKGESVRAEALPQFVEALRARALWVSPEGTSLY
jgi:hypothetical protein